MEAVTGRDNADVSIQGRRSEAEVEPLTNYMVTRVLREYNRAGFGFLTTTVARDLRQPSLRDLLSKRSQIAGADAYWFLDSKKQWVVTGKLAESFIDGSSTAIANLQQSPQHYFQRPDAPEVHLQKDATSMRGWSGDLNLNRQSGSVTVNAALWAVSPGFESNDIGFQNGGDAAGTHTVVFWKKTDPDRYTRIRQAWLSKWWTWDFGRKVTGDGWNGSAFVQYSATTGILSSISELSVKLRTISLPAAVRLPCGSPDNSSISDSIRIRGRRFH